MFKRDWKNKKKKFDIVIDLDITAPLRKVSDIKNALKKFKKEKAPNLFSACNARRNPYFNAVEWKNGKIKPVINLMKKLTSRQQAPNVYDMNASIYIWQRKTLINYNTIFLNKTSMYLMPEERSIDIDNHFDFKVVSKFLKWSKIYVLSQILTQSKQHYIPTNICWKHYQINLKIFIF